ncbi:hypothetical protein VTO42DRAFT_6304 [Malbranchea cinnamomea]
MSRPQVSIERLPARRMSSEPREAMNCKSCRKRKIKCNRTRPSCEACTVFQCPCIYDAVPKKRGPKTDVLEALLRRVDGLERRLQEGKRPSSPSNEEGPPAKITSDGSNHARGEENRPPKLDPDSAPATQDEPVPASAVTQRSLQAQNLHHHALPLSPSTQPIFPSDSAVDTFFARINGKPFHILDESTTRQQLRLGQLPRCLSMAIYTITMRYDPKPIESETTLSRTVAECTRRTRQQVDPDQPSIEGIQTLLILSLALYANGQGKKAYMTLSNCIAMAIALDLFREVSPKMNISPSDREIRRRLLWTCYMLDRFMACGSKRPSLISDHSLSLRLPSWLSASSGLRVEGEMFNTGPNIQYSSDPRRKGQDPTALLIDITRILGITNQYLAAGGVKGDSHFPWHALSNLSKIRQQLDIWASGTQDIFASIETFFHHPESTTLLLSKLIYHLIHCLIYRPFLPIDLVELRGTGQHQSWQIDATNLCFAHANAIAELVELGRNNPLVEWPGFVSYCICTAATVHIHGVHYQGAEGDVFSFSSDFLTREMNQLSWLQSLWASAQYQRQLLQTLYSAHSELVRTLASNPLRFSPVFHLEDFFDRYTGYSFDDSFVKLTDLLTEDSPNDSSTFSQNTPAQYPSHNTAVSPFAYPQHRRQSTVQHQTLSPPKSHHTEPAPNSPGLNFAFPPQTIPVTQRPNQRPSELSLTVPEQQTLLSNNTGIQSQTSSSTFPFSPFPPPQDNMLNLFPATSPPPNPLYATFPFDPHHQLQNNPQGIIGSGATALTPGAQSQGSHGTSGSEAGSAEKDPFLLLLEQLAENEQNSLGAGPGELDFFLAAGNATLDGDKPDVTRELGDTGPQTNNGGGGASGNEKDAEHPRL